MDYLDKYDSLTRISEENHNKEHELKDVNRQVFEKMANNHPDFAKYWIDKLSVLKWNNYLTKDEADAIVGNMINQDGEKSEKWNRNEIENFLLSENLPEYDDPFYNFESLFVVMNGVASDHLSSLEPVVSSSDLTKVVYSLALDKLKDVDRPYYVREYYKSDMTRH